MLLGLDACAILGGIEMPIWPHQPLLMGTIFDSEGSDDNSISFSDSLDRWGVHHWGMQCRTSQLSLTAQGNALVSTDMEQELQQQLAEHAKTVEVKQSVSWVCTEFVTCSEHHHPLVQSPTWGLKSTLHSDILGVLCPESSSISTFSNFSTRMKGLLHGIWTSNKYEEREQSTVCHMNSSWKQTRIPFLIGPHLPLIHAFALVPSAYWHPNAQLLTHNSLLPIPMHSALAPTTVPSISRPNWLVLSVRLLPSALDVFERHHPLRLNGVLGFQDVRDRTVNPQALEFDGGNQKHHLLFKSKGAHEQVEVHL